MNDSRFYIDIEDSSGSRLGPGPITSALSWSVVRRASKAGSFAFAMPANDDLAPFVTAKRVASIYAVVNGAWAYVGGGIIDRISRQLDGAGRALLSVAGDDMLRELTYRTVGTAAMTDGAGGAVSHATAVATVAALAPDGWTFTPDSAPLQATIYGQFAGETVLAAALGVAKQCYTYCQLTDRRTLVFGSTWSASGVRAIAAAGATLAAETCAITALTIEQQSTDLVTRVIPKGSGQSAVSLTLRACTRTPAAGYTLDTANNYLVNDAAESAYGRIERVVDFKTSVPVSNTTTDLVSAANQLYDNAYYYLSQRIAPVTNYRLAVAECNVLLAPLQTIRVAYRNSDAGIDLNADLYILEVAWSGDATGLRTAQLVVSDAPLWADSDTGAVVDLVRTNSIYQAHPQLNANSYVIPYFKWLDFGVTQYFRFRFDEDVLQLARVVFDCRFDTMEYNYKILGTDSIMESGDWIENNLPTTPGTTSAASSTSGVPSAGGTTSGPSAGGTTDGTTIGAVASANNTAPTAKATASNTAPTAKATASNTAPTAKATADSTDTIAFTGNVTPTAISLAGSTGAATITGVTENTTLAASVITDGAHTHTVNVGNSTSGTAVYYSGGGLYTSGGGTFVAPSNGAHTHGLSGTTHGHTITTTGSHSHGASSITTHTHTVALDHTHSAAQVAHAHNYTETAHTHNYTETAHTHNYTETQHTHTTTIPSHTHTYAAGSHTHTYAAGSHTHSVPTADHTHVFFGLQHVHEIVGSFGLFQDIDPMWTFLITELEYSLNGSTWYSWTAGVNGYEDLTGGWYRVDLTALLRDATTLRPVAANNALQIRPKVTAPAYKTCQIEAQLAIRNIIQALAL